VTQRTDYRRCDAPDGVRNARRAIVALLTVTLVLVAQEYLERGGRSLWPELNSLSLWTVSKLAGYLLPLALVLAWRGDHGLGLGDTRRHWKIYLTLYLAVLPLVVAASFGQGFRSTYPFHVGAHQLAWELVYGSTFVALEFFFRGFALFTLDRAIGKLSIFVLVVPYTMIHFGKPLPEVLGAVVAGVVLGYMALKTRSIWGGVAVHLGVAWTMDALALYHNMK
jgi:membrane protease YdiL (CAAX protease family)